MACMSQYGTFFCNNARFLTNSENFNIHSECYLPSLHVLLSLFSYMDRHKGKYKIAAQQFPLNLLLKFNNIQA